MSVKTKKKEMAVKTNYQEIWKNPMKRPYLEKIVLNIGVGSSGEELERAAVVLQTITGRTPVKTLSRKNIKEFGLRKGKSIGVKVTIRGEEAKKLLKRLLIVNNNKILRHSFDNYGNFGFGIREHISIPGVEYDNTIGIFGLDVCGRVVRSGMRVKTRRIKRSKIAKHHYVSREETQEYLKQEFNVDIVKKLDLEYM
ncbi:MAG: 50S ribosomal protein L5 [Promethearchaeota archaeon]